MLLLKRYRYSCFHPIGTRSSMKVRPNGVYKLKIHSIFKCEKSHKNIPLWDIPLKICTVLSFSEKYKNYVFLMT